MSVQFEDSNQRPLYAGARFGYSKPRMMKFLVKSGVTKSEENAVHFLVTLSSILFAAAIGIFLWTIGVL